MNHNPFVIATAAMAEPHAALIRAAGVLVWPIRMLVRAYRMRRTTQELQALDARILRDIGIERAGIDMIARVSVEHPAADPRLFLDRR